MTGGSFVHSAGLLSRRDEIEKLRMQMSVHELKQKEIEKSRREAQAQCLQRKPNWMPSRLSKKPLRKTESAVKLS
jgi:hypothetical protein